MKKLNIAIIGLGNIGCYLLNYLNINRNTLKEKNNCLPVVKYISAKNIKKRNIIKTKLRAKKLSDARKIKDLDLIVELIGGAEGP